MNGRPLSVSFEALPRIEHILNNSGIAVRSEGEAGLARPGEPSTKYHLLGGSIATVNTMAKERDLHGAHCQQRLFWHM